MQRGCQPADADANLPLVVSRIAEHQPCTMVIFNTECRQGLRFDVLTSRFFLRAAIIHAITQPADEMYAGVVRLHVEQPSEFALRRFNQHTLPLGIQGSHAANVAREVAFINEVGERRLIYRRREARQHAARRDERLNQVGRRNDVADAQPSPMLRRVGVPFATDHLRRVPLLESAGLRADREAQTMSWAMKQGTWFFALRPTNKPKNAFTTDFTMW